MQGTNFNPVKLASDALKFIYEKNTIIYGIGHKTPKKDGYFVKIYTRNNDNIITPLGITDVDYMLINLNKKEYLLLPQDILIKHNIIGKNGKRAFRCYSLNCNIFNKNAQEQKQWQIKFLFKLY